MGFGERRVNIGYELEHLSCDGHIELAICIWEVLRIALTDFDPRTFGARLPRCCQHALGDIDDNDPSARTDNRRHVQSQVAWRSTDVNKLLSPFQAERCEGPASLLDHVGRHVHGAEPRRQGCIELKSLGRVGLRRDHWRSPLLYCQLSPTRATAASDTVLGATTGSNRESSLSFSARQAP